MEKNVKPDNKTRRMLWPIVNEGNQIYLILCTKILSELVNVVSGTGSPKFYLGMLSYIVVTTNFSF